MAKSRIDVVISGMVLDDTATLSLNELCHASSLCAEEVIAMVDEGVLEPWGSSPLEWRFPAENLRRLHIAQRLQRDLQVNLAGIALALDLLHELRGLRERLRALDRSGPC
jgi:chaperone modulatory protein CbpM